MGNSRFVFLLFFLAVGFWQRGGEAVSFAAAQEKVTRPPINLHGVSFVTRDEGWVVGQLGKIFHTTDGGKIWEEQRSGTNLLLTMVDFVDRTHGWIVGERGTLLHTTDGGVTWQRQQSGVTYPLFDVQFLNRDTGWVVGHWGTILLTRDGGKQWIERSLSQDLEELGVSLQGVVPEFTRIIEPAALHDVVDPRTGEVMAKAGQLLSKELITEIARRGIRDVQVREDVVLNAVFFLDQMRGWIVGEQGLLLRTQDGGQTWERTVLSGPLTSSEGEAIEETAGVGEEMSMEELAALGLAPPPPNLYGVFFISPRQGWVVGQEGTLAWTQDGGQQWSLQPSGTREALYDVGVVGKLGWIVGDKGTVLVSPDGGRQWEGRELGLAYRRSWLRRLAVISGDHAFLVGANGLVLVSGESAEREIWVQRAGER